MANITLTGLFKDSLGAVDVGAVITFTHETTTGETLATTKSEIVVSPSGAYSITLEYGQIRIDYTTRYTERFIATVIVNGDTTATSLPELLNAAVPVTPAVILQMQGILSDAQAAATTSESFANQLTTLGLIASTASFATSTVINTSGYTTSGDGGKGGWKQNGVTGQTVSQSSIQLGLPLLNDGNGDQWSLVVSNGIVNMLSVGGIGGAVVDDTLAITAASMGGDVLLTNSTLIGALVLNEGSSLIGRDEGSVIYCNNGAGITNVFFPSVSGIDLSCSITNVIFIAKNVGGTCVETQSGVTVSLSRRPRYSFQSLLFRGITLGASGSVWQYIQGWSKCLSVGDCFSTKIDKMNVYGTYNIEADQSTSPDDTGIFLGGLQSVRGVRITNYQTSDVKFPLDIGENVTSAWLDGFDMSRSHSGIVSSHVGNSSELQILSGYVNAQYIGIHLNKRSWAFIDRVNVTRHPNGFDHSDPWIGLKLGNDFNDGSITNMRILDAGTWSNVGVRTAVQLSDVLRSKFNSMTCDSASGNLDFGFDLSNNSADLVFDNMIFDDIDVFWNFGAGSSDISVGIYEFRGAPVSRFSFDASIATNSIYNNFDLHGFGSTEETYDAALETQVRLIRSTGQRWDVKVATNDDFIVRDTTATENRIEIPAGLALIKFGGQIRPTTDNAVDNGSSAFFWRDTYSEDFISKSPDGTMYRLRAPDGGGTATWTAV
jgi:hypothetical protein